MTKYLEHGVSLSEGQKESLVKAIKTNSELTLRLKNNQLSGRDELMLTKTQLNKIKKAISKKTGVDIKISKTQIRKSVKKGGSLFSSLALLGAKALPYAAKAASKALPALATGAVSALGSLGIDKMFGKGQSGVFLIPQNKIDQLIKQRLVDKRAKRTNFISGSIRRASCNKSNSKATRGIIGFASGKYWNSSCVGDGFKTFWKRIVTAKKSGRAGTNDDAKTSSSLLR